MQLRYTNSLTGNIRRTTWYHRKTHWEKQKTAQHCVQNTLYRSTIREYSKAKVTGTHIRTYSDSVKWPTSHALSYWSARQTGHTTLDLLFVLTASSKQSAPADVSTGQSGATMVRRLLKHSPNFWTAASRKSTSSVLQPRSQAVRPTVEAGASTVTSITPHSRL